VLFATFIAQIGDKRSILSILFLESFLECEFLTLSCDCHLMRGLLPLYEIRDKGKEKRNLVFIKLDSVFLLYALPFSFILLN